MTKWQSVQRIVRKYILENDLRPGNALPSDAELAAMAKCSVQPVVHAMHDWAVKGLVSRGSGSRTIILSVDVCAAQPDYSFSASAGKTGVALINRNLEISRRGPVSGDRRLVEERAQAALGLARYEDFYVIGRIRVLDGEPRVVQRCYLDPKRFPRRFLEQHHFLQDSLISVYASHGYEAESRDTTLRSRLATTEEQIELEIGSNPILEAEQTLHAIDPETGAEITIEYMHAVYTNWEYTIKNRRP